MALQAVRKMRIIAVPLTRPNIRVVTPAGAKLNRLTYYQFQISAKTKKPPPPSTSTASSEGKVEEAGPSQAEKKGWLAEIREEGVVDWTTQKAADIWAGFGKTKGGWKLKVYQAGEKLMDRMEFEELALKSIDPSLGPSIIQLKRSLVLDEKNEPPKIPLIFPPSQLSPSTALSELRAYTGHRIPRHRKGFYFWMLLSPLTAPFIIVPIIPNLPFFFCVWRSWSHYRAYKSSQYLQSLLEHNIIVPEPSEPLDEVYRLRQLAAPPTPSESTDSSSSSSAPEIDPASDASSSSAPNPKEPSHILLLTRDAVPSILSIYGFKPESTAAADLYRAVEQARVRVSTGRPEL
ncbi:mitochondrial K+-H+ exchange-related-domain-containing protein [Flammula alnicola]|nr:mitochondrial K+-H+ exchange-related-domain-containing protein [Flammula alnicola]